MNFAIYTSGNNYCTKEDVENLLTLSKELNFKTTFNESFARYAAKNYGIDTLSFYSEEIPPSGVDFMVSYGGDGAFLHCVALLEDRQIPILGINSGRLGFLSSVSRDDFAVAFRAMINGEFTIEERSMIEVKGEFGVEGVYPHLFNEFTVQKSELNMITVSIDVDEQHLATVASDGLIVSTPSGSTAYSLSAGGAIIAPSCKAFIITPIAPHNLTIRPVVVDQNSTITIGVTSHIGECYATLDNRSYKVKSGAKFTLALSPINAKMVQLNDSSFFDTLRKKLMWASLTKRAIK